MPRSGPGVTLSFLTVINVSLCLAAGAQQQYFRDPDTLVQRKLEEWQDLKLGLLLHWGPYSQWSVVESWSICPEDLSWATGGRRGPLKDNYYEYKTAYEQLPKTFNPSGLDPDKWADAARNAGMKYVIFTTKHHDGFCMFDTKTTGYKITGADCPYSKQDKADATARILDAFRKKGLKAGTYFSKPDWHCDYYWWEKFPPTDRNCNYSIAKYPDRWQQFKEFTSTQIDELMSNYGRIDILWLDGGWVRSKSAEEIRNEMYEEYEGSRWIRNPQSQDLDMASIVSRARARQPGLIVVDRAVPGIYQNYLTPENHIPEEGLDYPWETCMPMATSWSYVEDDVYKPASQLILNLVDVVSKGGNLLLNIGPGPDGRWHDAAYQKLDSLGKWLHTNGEAVYGTRKWSVWHEGDDLRFTASKDGKTLYVFFLHADNRPYMIHSFSGLSIRRVSLLGRQKKESVRLGRKKNEIVLQGLTGEDIRVIKIDLY